MLVDFSHAADAYGYGADGQISKRISDQHVFLCVGRIESRGAAHHTLTPSPKLHATLRNIAKTAEPPSPEELAQFSCRVSVDLAKSPSTIAFAVIEELRRLKWLQNLRSTAELRPKVEVACQAYQRAESQWRDGAAIETAQNDWLEECRGKLEAVRTRSSGKVRQVIAESGNVRQVIAEKTQRQRVPLYWKIDLPEVSRVLHQKGILPTSFTPVEHPHTTLLYLSGETDEECAKASNISLEKFVAMREALEALDGEVFEVRMMEIVIEAQIVCAVVSLPPIVPCANKIAHVTLGTNHGVSPKYANEMLEEVKSGRKEGITSIPLPTPRPLKGALMLQYSD